jgi:hypothetical protein
MITDFRHYFTPDAPRQRHAAAAMPITPPSRDAADELSIELRRCFSFQPPPRLSRGRQTLRAFDASAVAGAMTRWLAISHYAEHIDILR